MIRYAVALLSLSCLFASSALAQEDLLVKAKQQFEAIPTAPPELPGNVATPGKVELGKMLYSTRGSPRVMLSAAVRAIVSGSAVPTPNPPPSAIAGSTAGAMLPRS